MPRLSAVATHLPVWGSDKARVVGADEDAVTLAVAAGRSALDAVTRDAGTPAPRIRTVVLVTRDLPTVVGGIEPILLAGLGLAADVRVAVQLAGASGALDALATAAPDTLVIAVDVAPAAAAAAAVVGADGGDAAELVALGRSERSLPIQVRDLQGNEADYGDPRLLRVRGTQAALARLDLQDKPVAVAGLSTKDAAALVQGSAAPLPSLGAAASLFAVADAVSRRAEGPVVALEQGSAAAALIRPGRTALVSVAPTPRAPSKAKLVPGGDIKFSLPAYERAFDSKLGLAAGTCRTCGRLELPPRRRCLTCGSEEPHDLTPLPREGIVYTAVSVHVPVPGLASPYGLAVIELGDTGVRLLTPLTGVPTGSVEIGDRGTVVLRKLAVRAGVPDYGYAFEPADPAAHELDQTGTQTGVVA